MEKNRLNTRFHRNYRQITKSKLFYQIKIFLPKKFNAVENIFSPQIPEMNYKDGTLSWNDTSKNISYSILQNGKTLKECSDTPLKIDSSNYGDYQIIAVANNHTESFASEPLAVYPSANQQIVQIEDFGQKSNKPYQGFTGKGFVEISKTETRKIDFSINRNEDGNYILDVRYANGNGPINTENKCAFRTITIDDKSPATLVFPQRGKEEWSN